MCGYTISEIGMKKLDPASLEVLAAIGAWTLHNAQGKSDVAEKIFKDLLYQFQGRYPHHKLLSHWTQEAQKPFRLVPDEEKVQICTVASRLSARLPSGEVLSYDADDVLGLAEELHKRGAAADDVVCAIDETDDDRARAVSAVHAALIAERMWRLESLEWRKEANEAWKKNPDTHYKTSASD